MTETTIENHKIVVMEHELVVDGVQLKERKQLTTVSSDSCEDQPKSVLVHTRTIDDRFYEVKEVKVSGDTLDTIVNTTLNEEEVQQFQKQWKELWCPTITDDQIANNQVPGQNIYPGDKLFQMNQLCVTSIDSSLSVPLDKNKKYLDAAPTAEFCEELCEISPQDTQRQEMCNTPAKRELIEVPLPSEEGCSSESGRKEQPLDPNCQVPACTTDANLPKKDD